MAWCLTLLAVLGTALRAYSVPTEPAPGAKSSYCANVNDNVSCVRQLLAFADFSLMTYHQIPRASTPL